MPIPDTVARAVVAAQRAQAQQIEHIAVLLESWVGKPLGMPDVVPRAAAAAWDGVAQMMQSNDELLRGYVDPAPAQPQSDPA